MKRGVVFRTLLVLLVSSVSVVLIAGEKSAKRTGCTEQRTQTAKKKNRKAAKRPRHKPKHGRHCPVYEVMDHGTYKSYYAVHAPSCWDGPCLLSGNLKIGCPDGDCVESRKKDRTHYVVHPDLANKGMGQYGNQTEFVKGVFHSGPDVLRFTAKDGNTYKARVYRIVVHPEEFTLNPNPYADHDPLGPLNIGYQIRRGQVTLEQKAGETAGAGAGPKHIKVTAETGDVYDIILK